MDSYNYLFPFEFVDRNSKVIIYGLGKCGREYIAQIEETGWCRIVGVCDKYQINNPYEYESVSFEGLKNSTGYDYLILAIAKDGVYDEAYNALLKNGVDKKKIISRFIGVAKKNDEKNDVKTERKLRGREKNKSLEVLFIMRGGIGDGVMELALYEELIRMVPDMVIDVYGESYFKYIYSTKKNIRDFYDYHYEKYQNSNYDLVIEASWGVTILHCDLPKVLSKSNELYETILKTYEAMKSNALVNRVCMARLKSKDKFWLMGREGTWSISPQNIHVDLLDEYKTEFENLRLNKYITFNCGADMRRITEEDEFPTKVWPVGYFEELIKLINKRFPQYEIIQLGAKNTAKVNGASRHILGENMELVKHIVANSELHIDDEGGLVHLATAFGTKCIVLFGPTPKDLLGYPQNINLSTDVCRGCFPLGKWNAKCALGMRKPKCMYSLTPELVMEYAGRYLDSLSSID